MSKKSTPVKVDPRVRRTHRLLREAMVALIMKKDYGSITIRDVTDHAEVAYITFFRHFESLDDLLTEVVDEGLAELRGYVETLAQQSEGPVLETEGKLIFDYVNQKADLFRILIKSQNVTRIRKKLVQMIAATFEQSCQPLARCNNQVAINLLSNHIATSLLSLVEWWLDNNLNPSSTEMGKVYKSLIIDSTVGAVSSLSTVGKRHTPPTVG